MKRTPDPQEYIPNHFPVSNRTPHKGGEPVIERRLQLQAVRAQRLQLWLRAVELMPYQVWKHVLQKEKATEIGDRWAVARMRNFCSASDSSAERLQRLFPLVFAVRFFQNPPT